jgi:molybdopterin molybdotransferase
MIDFDDALKMLLSESPILSTKDVPLTEAIGRVIATNVNSPIDLPSYKKATIDGFALFSEDAKDKKAIHEVIGSITAGNFPKEKLQRGQAMQIQAEAPLPSGSDTVVPMEEVRLLMDATRVGMLNRIRKNDNIIQVGDKIKKDENIINAGQCLSPTDLGILSSVGMDKVPVYSPPRVGIMTVGSEFKCVGEKAKLGQDWDSNGIQLLTALYEMKSLPEYLGTVADKKDEMISALSRSKSCNMVILTGITGVNRIKLLKAVFNKIGIKMLFEGISLSPFGMVKLAKFEDTLIVVLPQDPLFTIILFEALVVPSLRKMMGYKQSYFSTIEAVLEKKIKNKTDCCLLYPGKVYFQKDRCFFKPCDSPQRMDILSYAKCNGLLKVTKENKTIKSGKLVEIILVKQMCDLVRKK